MKSPRRHLQATRRPSQTTGSVAWEGVCLLVRASRNALGFVLMLAPLIGLLVIAAVSI